MEELYSCVYRLSSNPMMAFSVDRYTPGDPDGGNSSRSGNTAGEASGRRRGRSLASGGASGKYVNYEDSDVFGGYVIPKWPHFYDIFDVSLI